ncbi:MAG: DinB family protein [Candidatus Eisenbacteria bacterium]|nr:DinB family protein [Candidatus Eisenbacteria bacterium]
MKPAKRTAKKVAAPRPKRERAAAKQAANKPAKRATRQPRVPAAKKLARGRAVRGVAAKKVAAKRLAARRPALGPVPRRKPAGKPARTPARKPAFPQRARASGKQLVLFELMRARAALHGAIQGLAAAAAEQPLAAGKWNAREIVLHLVARDQARLREFERTLRGERASWAGRDEAGWVAANARDLEPLRRRGWDEAVRLLHATRGELMDAVEAVPEEPAEVWNAEHPFGWMLHVLPPHDRHHADAIKRWRAESGA